MKLKDRARSKPLSRALGYRRLGTPPHSRRQLHHAGDQSTDPTSAREQILPTVDCQLDLFGLDEVIEIYQAQPKFARQGKRKKRKSKKRAHRKAGLQYKIELRIRKTDRQVQYRPKDNVDHKLTADSEVRSWSSEGVIKLYKGLLVESLKTAKERDRLSLQTHAEIWYWINRKNAEEPFSFIRCCEYSGVDPDIMRPMLRRELTHDMPHIDLLRTSVVAAEAGDPDAIEWCLSDTDGPLTFVDTCRAAGFDASKARTELRLPVDSRNPGDVRTSVAA